MSASKRAPDSEREKNFSRLFQEGLVGIQKTDKNLKTPNAAVRLIAPKVGRTESTVWNWANGIAIPYMGIGVQLVLAFRSLTEKDTLSEDWYTSLLWEIGRRKHDIEYHRKQYREIVAAHQSSVDTPVTDTDISNAYASPKLELANEADLKEQPISESGIVATKLASGLKTRLALAIALGWWLIVGVLPLLVLTIEFGTDYGLYFARVYPHFFLQPLFFGFFLGVATAVMIQVFSTYGDLKLFLLIALGCGAFATLAEVTGEDTTIWETKPDIGYLSPMDNQKTLGENFQFLLSQCPADPTGETFDECSSIQSNVKKRLEENALSFRNSSITRWFYAAAVFIYISTISLFTLFTIFLQRKKATLASDEGSFENLGLVCGWGLAAISLWFPLRLASNVLKQRIYGEPDWLSTIVIVTVFVFVCVLFFFNYGTRRFSWFTALAISILAFSVFIFFVQPNMLVSSLVGDLEQIALADNVRNLVPKFTFQFVPFLVMSIQLLIDLLKGEMQFWPESHS